MCPLFVLGIALIATPGCGEKNYQAGSPSEPFDATRAWVEGLRAELHDPLMQRVESRAGRTAFDAELVREDKKAWRKRIASSIKYADLFKRVYAEHDYDKFMANYKGLTPRGKLALERIKSFETHHVNEPMDYHIKAIEAAHDELVATHAAFKEPSPIILEPAEIEALIALAREHDLPHNEASKKALVELLVDTPLESNPTPRIARMLATIASERASTAELTAHLELLVVDGTLRFARDMKHFNLARLSWKELKDAGGSRKVIYDRLEAFWLALKQADDQAVPALLDSTTPAHPDYTHLRAMRLRYIDHITRDVWPKVTAFTPTLQASSKHAPALRRRLMVEGYLPDTLTDAELDAEIVDAPLVEAVELYHTHHQLSFSGRPHRKFWKALTASPSKRLKLIDLNLERLRASRYEGEKDYVFVNLPDFHAEVYEDRKQAMRFKVVIGKNNRKCDPETNRFIYPNATPELISRMEHFILNPSWYVPERIIEEEIKPNVEKDETWLKRHNYEIVKKRGERWIVRQTPGPHNALGLVKFIFPNPHNTYMHDTARKEFFDYERRAYSHGCMRVHEPLKLAKYLVDFDAQGDTIDVEGIVKSKQSKMVKLKRDLPVFVEYHTIQFDPDGRPRFLNDIYRRDRRDLSKNPRSFDRCNGAAVLKKDAEEATTPSGVAPDLGP